MYHWIVLRGLLPLALGGLLLVTRSGAPFMETFVASIWIGFGAHVSGWFWLARGRVPDAASFLLLLFYYSQVAEIAWAGGFRAAWFWVGIGAYFAYLASTGWIWYRGAKISRRPLSG